MFRVSARFRSKLNLYGNLSGLFAFNRVTPVIKQRYIWVSRITGGARANTLGQIAQRFVAQYIEDNLRLDGLGHLPTREELAQYGKYPIRHYDEYFVSWGEVCAAARTTGMTEVRPSADDEEPSIAATQLSLGLEEIG